MAEVLALVVTIAGLVELCIKHGAIVVQICETFKNIKKELAKLVEVLSTHWFTLECEIKFFAKFHEFVEESIKINFENIVNSLYAKLRRIGSRINEITDKHDKFLGKFKFVFHAKASLEGAISDFEKCHDRLRYILYLLPRSMDPRIGSIIHAAHAKPNKAVSTIQNMRRAFEARELEELVTYIPQPSDQFNSGRRSIEYTDIEIKDLSGDQHVIINSIPCEGPGAYDLFLDIHNLARVLKEVDPMTFGIPACEGVVTLKGPDDLVNKLEMVFNFPQELKTPRSLRGLFLSIDIEKVKHSVNMRVQLAKRLARTVLFVHSADFVHKNICPETIIVFDHRSETDAHGFGFPFLVGFEKVRLAAGITQLIGDTAWERDIYRHPTRQGQFPKEAYKMEHDIYSLGVCLLEVALWKSFVQRNAKGVYPSQTTESRRLLDGNRTKFDMRDKLVRMARERIPNILGDLYTEVTISCLKCLDKSDDGEWEPFSQTGVSTGATYIEKILEKLNKIAV